jgi:N-acetyltransferase
MKFFKLHLIGKFWGGYTNSELKTSMLNHAFSRVKTVWFHVDATNIRSQKAIKN